MNTRIASKILSAHLNPLVKHSQQSAYTDAQIAAAHKRLRKSFHRAPNAEAVGKWVKHNTHRMLPAWQYGRMHVAHDRAHKRALARELTWAEALRQRIEAFVASTPGTGA